MGYVMHDVNHGQPCHANTRSWVSAAWSGVSVHPLLSLAHSLSLETSLRPETIAERSTFVTGAGARFAALHGTSLRCKGYFRIGQSYPNPSLVGCAWDTQRGEGAPVFFTGAQMSPFTKSFSSQTGGAKETWECGRRENLPSEPGSPILDLGKTQNGAKEKDHTHAQLCPGCKDAPPLVASQPALLPPPLLLLLESRRGVALL